MVDWKKAYKRITYISALIGIPLMAIGYILETAMRIWATDKFSNALILVGLITIYLLGIKGQKKIVKRAENDKKKENQ